MQNSPPPEDNLLENLVSDLRDEYVSQTPAATKLEAPKIGKEIRIGKDKFRWLNYLALFVIAISIVIGAFLINYGKEKETIVNVGSNPVIEIVPAEDLATDPEPTLPETTAVPVPTPPIGEIPIEPALELPEPTPWPEPPLTEP